MDIKQAQEDISNWGFKTFGEVDPGKIATRMNCEVAELLVGMDKLRELEFLVERGADEKELTAFRDYLGDECADIFIMLVQVSQCLGIDLDTRQQRKMDINRARVWATGANGKAQHVEPDHPAQIAKDIGKQIFPGFETDDPPSEGCKFWALSDCKIARVGEVCNG